PSAHRVFPTRRSSDLVSTCEMIKFASESPTQGLHARGLPMGQVGQGALADLVTVTKRLAQQDRWRRSAIGNGLDIHGSMISLIKDRKSTRLNSSHQII